MFYAMLIVNEEKYLMVAFKSLSEHDTFVKHSEFINVSTPVAESFSYDTSKKCRLNNRTVFDNNGRSVARIMNLYKPLMRV